MIAGSAARQPLLLYPSTGAPPTCRYSIRPTPAATCSSLLRLTFPDTLRPGEAHGSPSGSEVCRTWNNGCFASGFTQCKNRHKCAICHGPYRSVNCPSPATYRRSRSHFRSPPSPASFPLSIAPRFTSSLSSSVSRLHSSFFLESAVLALPLPISCALVPSLLCSLSSFDGSTSPLPPVFLLLEPSLRSVYPP